MIDYLYYRIYLVIKKTSLHDIPLFATAVALGGFLGLNFMSLYTLGRKLEIGIPHIFIHKYIGGVVMGVFIIFNYIVYVAKKRSQKVIEKYQDEKQEKKNTGNLILLFYVILTFIFLFLVAFYKPGVT